MQGPVAVSSMNEATCMHFQLSEDAQINKQLHAFWDIESLGITSERCKNPEDLEALQQFEKTIISLGATKWSCTLHSKTTTA